MPPEPETDAQRLQRFIEPCGVLLTERTEVLARIYAGAMVSGTDRNDDRLWFARTAVNDFLLMLDEE